MFTASVHGLRVIRAGAGVYPPGATFGPRRMTDFEFVWIIEGGAQVSYDDHRMDAPAGTLLLCRPEMTDCYEWSPREESVHAFFHFEFTPGAEWPPPTQWPLKCQLTEEDILRPLFRYVLHLNALPEPLRSSLMESCVEFMLKSFISGAVNIAAEPSAELPVAVEKAMARIRQNLFQEPAPQLSLTQLACAAHVTPAHLCRLFRRVLHRGPLECARLARLGRAAVLLARSNLPIKQVAYSTGFQNPYHFSRRFRDLYGLSPRAYRRACREGQAVPSNPFWQGWLLDYFSKVP